MKQLPFKAVLLDCDGVLYDRTLGLIKALVPTFRQTTADFGIDPETYDRIGATLRSRDIPGLLNFAQALARHAGGVPFDTFCAAWVARIDYTEVSVDPETVALLIQLLSEVQCVVIFTNNHRFHVSQVLQRIGCEALFAEHQVFDVVSTVDENGLFHPKPRAQSYMSVLNQLGFSPAEAVMVDDTAKNLAAAQALGMYTVHIAQVSDAASQAHETHASLKAWLRAIL